jgi:hypothetical protein
MFDSDLSPCQLIGEGEGTHICQFLVGAQAVVPRFHVWVWVGVMEWDVIFPALCLLLPPITNESVLAN